MSSYLPAYEDGTECSETLAYKMQTPGNYPEESVQHGEHGESLKSRISYDCHNIGSKLLNNIQHAVFIMGNAVLCL